MCRESRHRVTKVLRMDLRLSEVLLKDNPNLKVVQLFRDPRAVISSHLTTEWFPTITVSNDTLYNDIKVTCKRMRYDIESAIYLVDKYPDRVRVVQYEDYIENTVDKMRSLYQFLGMKFSKEYDIFVKQTSEMTGNTKHSIIASPYRPSLSWDIVKLVDTHCKDVIQALGLNTYPSKAEYLNITMFNPISNHLPFAILSIPN